MSDPAPKRAGGPHIPSALGEEEHATTTGLRPSMTVIELAATVGVDPSTAYRYLRAGELPGVRVGSHWAIDRARVDRFLAGQEDAAGRPLFTPPTTPAPLTLLPEPTRASGPLAHDEATLAFRWLQGAHAALGLLLQVAAFNDRAESPLPTGRGLGEGQRGGQRVAG